jgi:hypothetical protein
MEVLGLASEQLASPCLDVGCGERGLLVTFLRSAGLSATGFDERAVEEWIEQEDWHAYHYGADRWALITSHLAFSLHFFEAELAGRDDAFDFAGTYRRILRSLRPGGVFAYVPSLPFIERLLGPAFEVRRRHIPGMPLAQHIQDARTSGLGEASQVRRLF